VAQQHVVKLLLGETSLPIPRQQLARPRRIQSRVGLLGCVLRLGGSPSIWSSTVFISSAFAQTAPAAAGGDIMSSLTGMLPLVLMFVVLYFVMIRPQMKRQKEHKAMIDALAKGDEVATAGGLLGKVSKIGDTTLSVEIATGVEVQLQRSAVVQVLPKGTVK
jgi:preprotein translocase subunit YajC